MKETTKPGRTKATLNTLGQPIGSDVEGWTERPWPPQTTMLGRTCRLERLNVERHGPDLERAFVEESEPRQWTYLPYGPFDDRAGFRAWLAAQEVLQDPFFYTIIEEETDAASGLASYLRIQSAHGVIEVGHIHFSPRLQKTVAATEAMYWMMKRAFDLGYRRYEWKCDSLNAPSMRAAQRLGFKFEGIFHQNVMYKGRNRDTAWFSILDHEWPRLEEGFRRWLSPDHFDARGQQKGRLQDLLHSSP
jgi:RimJ/RimL family protein N-acetyltransferase